MEKRQDRFNYARDGQMKLHIWGNHDMSEF